MLMWRAVECAQIGEEWVASCKSGFGPNQQLGRMTVQIAIMTRLNVAGIAGSM